MLVLILRGVFQILRMWLLFRFVDEWFVKCLSSVARVLSAVCFVVFVRAASV